MTMTARLLQQRSAGSITLHMEKQGPRVLRESGAAKVRIPRGGRDAILINTSGGLAGGDRLDVDIACGADACLTVTSQAAERVYRTLGPPAAARYALTVEQGAALWWIPQETIMFDSASLRRHYAVCLAAGARFLAVEPVVFGRAAMGERIGNLALRDSWRIRRGGHLIHADDLDICGALPTSHAALGGAAAMASFVYVGSDAEAKCGPLRTVVGGPGGASAWNGKLIARIIAADGFDLRRLLIAALSLMLGADELPRVWAA